MPPRHCGPAWAEGKVMSKTVREWLLEIAAAVEKWPTMPKDSVEVAISVSTPSGVVDYITRNHIPPDIREAVSDALPVLLPADFAEAARRIRQAATPLPPT